MPEIARAAGIWPKFFSGYWARHPQKFSLTLTHTIAATSLVGLIAYARLYELASAEMQPLSFHLLFDCY